MTTDRLSKALPLDPVPGTPTLKTTGGPWEVVRLKLPGVLCTTRLIVQQKASPPYPPHGIAEIIAWGDVGEADAATISASLEMRRAIEKALAAFVDPDPGAQSLEGEALALMRAALHKATTVAP